MRMLRFIGQHCESSNFRNKIQRKRKGSLDIRKEFLFHQEPFFFHFYHEPVYLSLPNCRTPEIDWQLKLMSVGWSVEEVS